MKAKGRKGCLPGHVLIFLPLASHGIITSSCCLSPQGCFEHIGHAIDSYTWGISWFGFAILMWTVRAETPVGCGRGRRGRPGVWVSLGETRGSGVQGLILPLPAQLPVMLIAMYLYTTL